MLGRAVTLSDMRLFLFVIVAGCLHAQAPDVSPWEVLDHGVQDGNPAKRIEAVLATSVLRPDARALAFVEGAMKDKDSGVRQAVCTTLGEMKARAAVPFLRQALDDNSPEVIFAAAKALYAMGDPAGRAVLIAVLSGEQSDASGLVSSSLRDAKLKLHDPKALLLIGVNEGAGLLGPFGAGVPIAERLLKDNQASGKTVAALLLSTDTSQESKAAVKAALGDKNWTVRVAAVRAVAIRDITPFRADVAALLDDKREEVRLTAAAAIIRLKQPR